MKRSISKSCIRRINNDDRIRRNVANVAEYIEQSNLKKHATICQKDATKQLIAVIDGGHLKSSTKDSRSFEAIIATIFSPVNIKRIDKHHNEITKKTSVASALNDNQNTIKNMFLNACRKEGMNARTTEITCLTDGANNCWPIANSVKKSCKKLMNILDWFHITKRFTAIYTHVDANLKESLEKVKWFLWHGKPKSGLERLSEITQTLIDEKLMLELQDLYKYLDKNQKYMVNYQQRQTKKLPLCGKFS